MRRAVLALVVTTLLVSAVPAVAKNPLDDDAGSGRDAGDTPDDAIPIEVGEVPGRLTPPADRSDHYRIHLEEGQVLGIALDAPDRGIPRAERAPVHAVILDAQGRAYQGVLAESSASLIVPRTGTWYVEVASNPAFTADTGSGPPAGPIPYRLDLRIEHPATVDAERTAAGAHVGRLEFDGPYEATANIRVPFATETDRPSDVLVIIGTETDDEDRTGVTLIIHLRGDGTGSDVEVRTPVRDARIDVDVDPVVVNRTLLVGSHFESNRSGAVHITVANTASRSGSRIAFASPLSVEPRWPAEQLVTWNETDGGADVQVAAPGASMTGERTRTLDAGARFDGLFRAGTGGGWIEAPDGSRQDVLPGEAVPLSNLTDAPWMFHLGPTVGVGPTGVPTPGVRPVHGAQYNALLGVVVPDAGS